MSFIEFVLVLFLLLSNIYHACSAPSNLQAQSYVDNMLVSTSGLAEVTNTAGVSLKNLKIDGIDVAVAMVVKVPACITPPLPKHS